MEHISEFISSILQNLYVILFMFICLSIFSIYYLRRDLTKSKGNSRNEIDERIEVFGNSKGNLNNDQINLKIFIRHNQLERNIFAETCGAIVGIFGIIYLIYEIINK